MTFTPQHAGLIFNHHQLQQAQSQRDHKPYQAAWSLLLNATSPDDLTATYWNALRWRANNDSAAGDQAVQHLNSGAVFSRELTDESALRALVVSAQCFEMARDVPAFAATRDHWLAQFYVRVEALNQHSEMMPILSRIWLSTVNIAAGIALENAAIFEHGAELYRETILREIHPDGYIKFAIEPKDTPGYARQLSATCALVLSAEMATLSGEDLWAFNNRGVSVVTSATYLLYYYYFPDKWRWNKNLTTEETTRLFREQGAFMEIVNSRFPLRGIDVMFDDLRPMFGLTGGGLTTLTHAATEARPKKRGLFG